MAKHEQGWDVVSINRQQLADLLTEARADGGFVGMRLYDQKNLGKVSDRVDDMRTRVEDLNRQIDRQIDDIETAADQTSR